jgi:ParB family transcriptional regulator, chromosome partitioning protein
MIRRPLGRGLGALLESTEMPSGAPLSAAPSAENGAPTHVAVGQIVPSPLQPRRHFDPERLEELARAISSQGIIEPLIVRPASPYEVGGVARYEVIAGERRLRAARAAGLDSVPVIVRELDDHAALEMSLVENLIREDLNAVEEARAFRRLGQDFNLSHEEIAARIGKSRPYVSNMLRLLDLTPEVLEMIDRRELSAGQARPLLALTSPEAQIAAAMRIVRGRISARGAEEMAGAARRNRAGAHSAPDEDPNLAALAAAIQRVLKRKIRIVRARGRTPGRVEIEYYSADDLTSLVAVLGVGSRPGGSLVNSAK